MSVCRAEPDDNTCDSKRINPHPICPMFASSMLDWKIILHLFPYYASHLHNPSTVIMVSKSTYTHMKHCVRNDQYQLTLAVTDHTQTNHARWRRSGGVSDLTCCLSRSSDHAVYSIVWSVSSQWPLLLLFYFLITIYGDSISLDFCTASLN